MTMAEFAKIAKAVKAYYPRETVMPTEESVLLWYDALKDIDYEAMSIGLKKWVMTNKFAPQVSELRETVASVATPRYLGWEEAWGTVIEAIRGYGFYQQEKALASLDEVTRKAVKIMRFTDLCMSENPMADRAQFRQIYENLVEREKQDAQIPQYLHEMIAEIQKKNPMLMGEHDERRRLEDTSRKGEAT